MDEQEQQEMENAAMQTGVIGQIGQGASQNAAAQYYMQEQEKGLADTQLEVDSIKSEVYHLLRQDKLGEVEGQKGKMDWIPIKDSSERVLSDRGVDRIMQKIHFYINKNTLLSNFDEDQIKRLMLKFIREVNDLLLMKYQVLFREPSFEECKSIILKKLENKTKMRMFTLDILGRKGDEEQIKQTFLNEIEKTLEIEMMKVKEEKIKENLRDYGSIIAELEIIVFATLNRAWRGEERGSLRRHMNVSELIGSKPTSPNTEKGGFFGWGRR